MPLYTIDVVPTKASPAAAPDHLPSEIERHAGERSRSGGLASWQAARVCRFIEENLHRNIDTRNLSAVVQRSPAHFMRSFKKAFGETPHSYVIKRRLERACHLMVTSSERLSEIALSVGLTDQAHLCRLFRRAFGQSPANWRRQRLVVSASMMGISEPWRRARIDGR